MELWKYEGEIVKVTFVDGDTMLGKVAYYTSALDNEPDPESITIGSYELFAPDIAKIEILQDS